MSAKKLILVTGGAGYIGSHTIIELLNEGDFEILSIDNYQNSSPYTYERIKTITGTSINHLNVDLCDKKATEQIFEQHKNIAGIIHFAALKSVPESVEKPLLYYHNNIASLVNLLACCQKYNINNFIFSSSCSIYGNLEKLPVTEETPFGKPESPYGYSKQIGEQMIRDNSRVNPKLQSVILRYFNPVGAHKSGLNGELPINRPSNLVPVITMTAAGLKEKMEVFGSDYKTRDGTCVRDYVHVTDIAIAHIVALKYILGKINSNNCETFNLGTGSGVTVLEALKSFEKISGIKPNYIISPRRPGDVEAIYSDNTKVERTLGWKPKYNIDQMMESAWKWQQTLLKEKA